MKGASVLPIGTVQGSVPDTADGGSVSLSFVRSADGVFYFDKTATLSTNDAALVIEFDRTSANASTLAIGTESITNSTGTDWTGFRTFVSTATAAGSSGVGFQLSLASGGFNIDRSPSSISPITTPRWT